MGYYHTKPTLEAFQETVREKIWQHHRRKLKGSEIAIIEGVWERKIYDQIAEDKNYCSGYLFDVGSKLWKDLSEAFDEKISKSNARFLVEQECQRGTYPNLTPCQIRHKDCFVGFLLFTQNTYAKSDGVGNEEVIRENWQAAFQPKFDLDTRLTAEIVVPVIDSLFFYCIKRHLTYFEEKVVCGIWNDEEYDDIANKIKRSHCKDRELCGSNCKCNYSSCYFRKNIADELWSNLSDVLMFLDYKINKDNFKPTLEQWHEKMKLALVNA